MTVEARKLGSKLEPLGLEAEVESRRQRLEEEMRDSTAMATLEDGRPEELAPY